MSKRPTAGHAESNACGDTSGAVRRSAQEPAEGDAIHGATSVGILSINGGCQINHVCIDWIRIRQITAAFFLLELLTSHKPMRFNSLRTLSHSHRLSHCISLFFSDPSAPLQKQQELANPSSSTHCALFVKTSEAWGARRRPILKYHFKLQSYFESSYRPLDALRGRFRTELPLESRPASAP
jgi:hypothetical protein